MGFQVGDRVVVESESTERPAHAGTVSEVVREQPPRYRIAWERPRVDLHAGGRRPARGAHERRYGELKPPRTGDLTVRARAGMPGPPCWR